MRCTAIKEINTSGYMGDTCSAPNLVPSFSNTTFAVRIFRPQQTVEFVRSSEASFNDARVGVHGHSLLGHEGYSSEK